ncbi:Basigin [Tupaia chinensis]|uniref:Basigin n=1 Tax=Tupaia chinensis TaxID=246437 RepID=L8Y4J9_TUPCH|nr:Basigin [Tupaia chinensis]
MEAGLSCLLLLALGAPSAGGGWSEAQIIGGHEAAPHSHPYMASLQKSGSHLCGAALVHPRWVLTAAHCLGSRTDRLRLVLGLHQLDGPGLPFRIKAVVTHPYYKPAPDLENDLALLQLDGKVKSTRTIRALALPRGRRAVATGVRCSMAGWGLTQRGGRLARALQELDLRERRAGGHVELHCEAVGSPVPEIQWWFEGNGPNATCAQLWDGARRDRVHIHATYRQHAASTISVDALTAEDAGTYECRASNDPDRNHLTRLPRVRWVRAQASVVVLERVTLRPLCSSDRPPAVRAAVERPGSRTRLTCTLNGTTTEVTGHRWVKGGQVLKEDTLPDLRTELERLLAGKLARVVPGDFDVSAPWLTGRVWGAGRGGPETPHGPGLSARPPPALVSLDTGCILVWAVGAGRAPGRAQLRAALDRRVDPADGPGKYSCIFLPEPAGRADIPVYGPPKVKAVKNSEHANEKETVTLACKSESLPPVTHWVWYKMDESGSQVIVNGQHLRLSRSWTSTCPQVIVNGSRDKFFVSSSAERTELRIRDLDVGSDGGQYVCNGTSAQGSDQATISLRVRSNLAALWPFLGIVAEVLVLVTIIFIYEKRRKPDEVLDDDDAGSAPLKSSSQPANDKGQGVRQRNAT